MKYAVILTALTFSACASHHIADSEARSPAALSAEFETLERDSKFEALVAQLDLESPAYTWEYKNHGTSVGFKVKKDDKSLGKFMPKNAAANPEAQVVSYYLGRFLHMGEIVVPSAYLELHEKAVAYFAQMLNAANEKNKWRIENR
ncbi:MAG: hypothetical protein ACXWQE_10840, partial [Bdellovibrionales bacterium]